jgi:DeoR family transcriptional regulator, aga operon transcriptional repressor
MRTMARFFRLYDMCDHTTRRDDTEYCPKYAVWHDSPAYDSSGPGPRVFVAGGEVRGSSTESVGLSAEAFLASCDIDVAFLGVDGVDAVAGCTNYDPVGARVNAALFRRARRRVVLADATKIGRVTLAPVCRLSEVDVLITDSRAAEPAVEAIRRLGCRVVRV